MAMRRGIHLKREHFREDKLFVEQIRRKAFVFARTRGDRLFGNFGERTVEEAFNRALEIGYYSGMHEMYKFFIEQGNKGLESGRYDGNEEAADSAE